MINNVVLVGRLTRDVQLRATTNGVTSASFTLAVNRRFKNANGESETDFINCVMWRKAAENFAQFTRKGSLVGIEGRIQTRNYEKNGQRVYVTEVVADNFNLLERRSESEGDGQVNSQTDWQNQNLGGFSSNFGVEISDEDLPF